ncbi:hypothetical protein [Piscibacillus salipiscarius]
MFPKWCFEKGNYSTVLTNDLDSLLGCVIEQYVNGYEINHFYDFNTLFVNDPNYQSKLIGVDLALHNGRSWCNHVVKVSEGDYVNPKTANINAINGIHKDNYFDKYAMSTALLMWSFYDLPLPKTKLGKMLILSIDSGFLGHYNDRFKDIHTHYLELLEFPELIDLLNETDIEEFYELQQQYKTKATIKLNDEGYLETNLPLSKLEGVFNLPLELPRGQFTLQKKYIDYACSTNKINSKSDIKRQLVSFALTNRNFCKFTYLKRERN